MKDVLKTVPTMSSEFFITLDGPLIFEGSSKKLLRNQKPSKPRAASFDVTVL